MPINFGTSGIGELYYGTTPIKEVYAGSQLVWSSGPSWPQTGSWSGNTTNTATTVASFTIPEAGIYNLEWAVTWGGTGTIAAAAIYSVNSGADVFGSPAETAPGTSTVNGSGVALSAGDVVAFRARNLFGGTRPATGAWTVTKT